MITTQNDANTIPWPYGRCGVCGKIIRMNKFLVGSMHFCLTDEEIRDKNLGDWAIENQRRLMR